MNWADLDKEFAEYEKEIPCPNCKKPAKPTVAGNNFKCSLGCGHLFREDGTKPEMECTCKSCNPCHDPLKGKTKGKKAELVMDDDTKKPKTIRRPDRATRKDTRSKH
jgi:hypothetical protein